MDFVTYENLFGFTVVLISLVELFLLILTMYNNKRN